MSLEAKYKPSEVESRWYQYWLDKELFNAIPGNGEAYSVVIPPPNVTGVLHMGHILNNTIQDILVRRARLLGKNVCWVPGTDHASIATEAKVVALLAEKGLRKRDIGRDEFLRHAWEWKEKHNDIIFNQLRKLGVSCDWRRARFTLDKSLSDAVIGVFISLYREGKIYRGARMINWDPKARTALSDEEVIRKEVQSKLYHVKYLISGSSDFVTVATTRPETILGDSAICVHPSDKRYAKLQGKKVIVPVAGREVPIISDEYVDMEFGSGVLKITPAHDVNDYNIGLRHGLEVIDTLNDDGSLSNAAGHFIGKDRFEARKLMVKRLEEEGLIVKSEEIVNNIGFSERNPDTIIEPKISTQWFLKMDELVRPAIRAVAEGEVKIHPVRFTKVYNNWLENINDWCISRQLWWGHRIPAWYDGNGNVAVAASAEEAVSALKAKGIKAEASDLKQDEDVLDTWFSAWLWPFSVFGWNEDKENEDLKFYYPTNDLVTGHDIIFFWVARMIMAGYHFTGAKPFSNVYFTGMVRDKQGRKMSKQLGNSPDALGLMETYGADGVRVGMLLTTPAGNDLQFDDGLCLQGRNFANKIWNAYRLVRGWATDEKIGADGVSQLAKKWLDARLNQVIPELDEAFRQYRISEALMFVYKLVWDDFCSWYLEMIKAEFGKSMSASVVAEARQFFEKVLILLHPFMPFITEEIWQGITGGNGSSIMVQKWPVAGKKDEALLRDVGLSQELVSAIRQFRKDQNIPFKESLVLVTKSSADWKVMEDLVRKMANIDFTSAGENVDSGGKILIVGKAEFLIPYKKDRDLEGERAKIEKDIEYTRGFMKSIEGKLKNEKFMANAPDSVVEIERKKYNDAMLKLDLLEKQLGSL